MPPCSPEETNNDDKYKPMQSLICQSQKHMLIDALKKKNQEEE